MAVVTDLEVVIPAAVAVEWWRQRLRAAQGRENGIRECDEEDGCTEGGERSSERERRTRTDDPEI